MAADLWRVSDGSYLFSERGVGVQPLALIALWHEVLNFIARKPDSKIVSRIGDLSDISMVLSYVSHATGVIGGIKDLKELHQIVVKALSSEA